MTPGKAQAPPSQGDTMKHCSAVPRRHDEALLFTVPWFSEASGKHTKNDGKIHHAING